MAYIAALASFQPSAGDVAGCDPSGCDQERLRKDEREAAILAQMTEVYADTSLVAAVLEEAQAETRARDAERGAERHRLEGHAAELHRKIDRYVAGFESGELRASFLQSRADELAGQLAAVETALAQEPAVEPASGQVDVGLVSWALSEALGGVLASTSPQLTKELLRILIREIRVVSPLDIRPTYRVRAAVTSVGVGGGLVEETGQYANRASGLIWRSLAVARPPRRIRSSVP